MARHAPSRGAPTRLACLVLLALVATVCLFVTASAAPAACPVTANGTTCVGCAPKSCKFDDNCHLNKVGQARRGVCQDLSDGRVVGPTDRCSGVQRKHGKNAPESVGGPGKKKKRCEAKSVSRPGFSPVACECVNKEGNNTNKKGQPVKKCKRCQQSAGLTVPAPPPPPVVPNPNVTAPPPPPVVPTDAFLPGNLMTMQGGAVKYTPSNASGNWTVLCQIPAQAKAVSYGASLTNAETTSAFADSSWLTALWTGSLPAIDAPPGLSTLYPGKTQYSADILNVPLFMSGSNYFDAAASWYKNGLPTDSAGKTTGGMAPASYAGNGKDFLDSYFRSGLQTGGSGTAAPSGSSSNSANAQILKKSSAYWVATTHVQYNLDMADINLAANKTADAKANLDSAAAAYYGCGDTNPVPLPKYKGIQITYPTTADSTDIGSNATTMSIYGVANKRAANYLTAKAVPGGTASATSPGTTKSVAQLNLDVQTAFNAATPTAATIQTIRDATNTIFAQAAQRYIAKITLAAHMPGNGMGGSTNAGQVITKPEKNPTKGYWGANWGIWTAADKAQSTACGGFNTQIPQQGIISSCATAGDPPACTGGTKRYGVDDAAVTPLSTTSLKMNGGLACSKMASGEGSAVSNTATFKQLQPMVKQNGSGGTGANAGTGDRAAANVGANVPAQLALGAAVATPTAAGTKAQQACPTVTGVQQVMNCKVGDGTAASPAPVQPYEVAMTESYQNDDKTKNGGLTNAQIKKATRGLSQSADVPADTVTPTACIGPDVIFNDVRNTGSTTGIGDTAGNAVDLKAFGVALCDPNGVVPANVAGIVGTTANQALPVPAPTQSYVDNKKWYSGVIGADAAGGQKNGVLISMQKFWDPITAAQASGGAFCCDAMYYGKDGIGRGTVGADPPIVGVTKNENFKPVPFVGATMNLQVSPGGVCTDGKPTTSVKEGLSEAVNVKEEEFLEGQAFYACLAPSQYVLPKISTQTVSTQTANAAKQKKCAQTMTKMLKMNKESAGTKTDDAKCKTTAVITATGANQALTGAGTAACTGTFYSAVEYPLWLVGIGGTTSPASYAVPNGYCYANACLEDFAAVGTATAFKGVEKLSTLKSSPDMASNPSTTTNGCGRANAACAAAPAGWNGGQAIFAACTKIAGDASACTLAEKQGQVGMLPSA